MPMNNSVQATVITSWSQSDLLGSLQIRVLCRTQSSKCVVIPPKQYYV